MGAFWLVIATYLRVKVRTFFVSSLKLVKGLRNAVMTVCALSVSIQVLERPLHN